MHVISFTTLPIGLFTEDGDTVVVIIYVEGCLLGTKLSVFIQK